MNRLLLFPLLVCLGSSLQAEDPAVAKQLQSIGGKVTMKAGIVSEVAFTDCTKIGEAELKLIGQLSHLKTLTLFGKCHGLNDSTIGLLAGLQELESFSTEGVQLTDDGLKGLAALKAVKSMSFFHLSFGMKGFTGVGFGHLKALPQLERLTVAGISMGDDGFAALGTLTQLKELRTWHTYQTEAANASIAKLTNLRSLHIGQRLPRTGVKAPSLSDASLPTFASMKSLETLELGEAHFTVPALLQFQALPKLKKLVFFETDLTSAEVDQLRAKFPNVTIDWKPLTADQQKKFDMYLPK
jgi:hypothetical protein